MLPLKQLIKIQQKDLENSRILNSNGKGFYRGMTWNRLFGSGHPYDAIKWDTRVARITKGDGKIVFEQENVEVPDFWSQTATDIVASKYFRGRLDAPERERSARQMVDRVADVISGWGWKDGYFASEEDYQNFNLDLKWLLINQYAAFNSPVWFNVGVHEKPQCSACFILSVEDNMASILEWYETEGWIFKGGSGSGINLSKLRSSKEALSKGGHSSGPVSFMKGADGVANSIRSGGTTRRAAKMVVLNVDHPDVKDFIYCKKNIEDMTKALEASGIVASIEGELFNPYTLLPYQNANNSVRVTDEFMRAVEHDNEWDLKAATTGETIERVKAREVMNWMADAAWHSADPGIQFDTTTNHWHTCPNTGPITASNPCFTGKTLIATNKGLIRFDELYERFNNSEEIKVYTHNLTSKNQPENSLSLTKPSRVMMTGQNPVYELEFSNGLRVEVTANHRFWTKNRQWVAAEDLKVEDDIQFLDRELNLGDASLAISTDLEEIYKSGWGGRDTKQYERLSMPAVWTSPFAEYIGYMVGDGSLVEAKDSKHRLSTASAVFGNQEEADELWPRFGTFLSAEFNAKPHLQAMPNGTLQMRVNSTPFVRFLKELGMTSQRAHLKHVPSTIFETPRHISGAFLRGLFTADGCVYDNQDYRYIGLGSTSKELLEETQQLLFTFGIFSRIYKISKKNNSNFSYTKNNGTFVTYNSRQMYDLRIAGPSINTFNDHIGFLTFKKQEKLDKLLNSHEFYKKDYKVCLKNRNYIGEQTTYNLTEPKNHSYIANGLVVANCSEYVHLDNSACNLASINLLKFLRTDGSFDVELFKGVVDTLIAAQDMLVDNSSYPTEKIGQNARDYRELGLGYANLGALLMMMGLPYDSDQGRAMGGLVTSVLGGEAYAMSARLADIRGSFTGYIKNKEPMLRVISQHRDAAEQLAAEVSQLGLSPIHRDLKNAAREVWHDAMAIGQEYGFRNSQATVLAPTGTISFLMDCDTTGIEPELALVRYKKLVGGGTIKLVNNQVPNSLRNLGYNEEAIQAITQYILQTETIEGAPGLEEKHLPVFDCSFKAAKGTRSIHYTGHLKMMAAAQPFISGAISKTANLPASATKEEMFDAFMMSWKLGLKAVAFYRDGSKSVQPLNVSNTDKKLIEKVNGYTRVKLPDERPSITHKFSVANYEGYITVGLYPDTMKPAETFITIAKEGSTISGLFDTIATLISLNLQSGIPLKTLIRKFKDARFEPSGMTTSIEIPFAKSLIDYIFRYLGMKFLSVEDKEEIFGTPHVEMETALESTVEAPIHTPELQNKVLPVAELASFELKPESQSDAPMCPECGSMTFRAGSCYTCPNCFATTGVCN